LPLALEQAAAYVVAAGTVSLAEYSRLFGTRALELLQREQPLGYQHTVATTWSLALQKLQDTAPAAVELLTLAAFLAPDDVPQHLLVTYHNQLSEPLAAAIEDPLSLADAVAALRRYSLIRLVADGLFVHRLLQMVIRTGLIADAERAWAAGAVRLLHSGFPSHRDEFAYWPECDRLLPHALAAVENGQRLDVELKACFGLLHNMGMYLRSRGQNRQALTLDEQAVAGRRRILGDDHPDTLVSMNSLAVDHRGMGDLSGARELHEQALAGLLRVVGEEHPYTLFSMNNLGLTIRALGDLPRARDLLERTLTGRRKVFGDDHPATLRSLNHVAQLRRDLGDLSGARDLLERTLATCRRVLGEDDPLPFSRSTTLPWFAGT
jgi:hypothetical protein